MPNHENPFAFNAEADKTVTVSGRGPTNLNAFVSPVNLQKTVAGLVWFVVHSDLDFIRHATQSAG